MKKPLMKIEPGEYLDSYQDTYTVVRVFGRGKNRQAKLDRPLPGHNYPYVHVRQFRKIFTRKT